MSLNIDKRKVMHVCRGSKKSVKGYMIGMQDPLETKVERDMDILKSDDLKPRNQVVVAATKANIILRKFKQIFQCRSLGIWETLYTNLIRPHLKFATQALHPYLIADFNSLEQVQHRATKLITSIKNKLYEERLSILGITNLPWPA